MSGVKADWTQETSSAACEAPSSSPGLILSCEATPLASGFIVFCSAPCRHMAWWCLGRLPCRLLAWARLERPLPLDLWPECSCKGAVCVWPHGPSQYTGYSFLTKNNLELRLVWKSLYSVELPLVSWILLFWPTCTKACLQYPYFYQGFKGGTNAEMA